MFLYKRIGHGQYGIHPAVVLVHMNILVPFYAHHRFILVNLRHTLLVNQHKHQHTEWKRNYSKCHRHLFMCKHPFYTSIIETYKPLVLQEIFEAGSKPVVLPYTHTVEQYIQHRQQHDTSKIRDQQSRCDRKCFIHENGTGYPTHEHQRYEHRYSGKRRTKHGRNHFRSSRHSCTFQRIPLLPVLRYIFCHNDRIIYHHTHRQYHSRKRNYIERYFTNIEKGKSNDYRSNHGNADNQWRTYIPDKKESYNKYKQKTQRKILL